MDIDPKSPNKNHRLDSLPQFAITYTPYIIIGIINAINPKITKKTYPTGCFLLKLSSDEGSKKKDALAGGKNFDFFFLFFCAIFYSFSSEYNSSNCHLSGFS